MRPNGSARETALLCSQCPMIGPRVRRHSCYIALLLYISGMCGIHTSGVRASFKTQRLGRIICVLRSQVRCSLFGSRIGHSAIIESDIVAKGLMDIR
jgi:hypothetical protein